MSEQQNKHSITVFSTSTCPWCVRAKHHLDGHGVVYKDVNVGEDYAAAMMMVQKSGQMGVPQFWIDNEVIIGFDQGRIDALLGIGQG